MPRNSSSTPLCVRIKNHDLEDIGRVAKNLGISKNRLINFAIVDWLSDRDFDEPVMDASPSADPHKVSPA